MKTTLKILLVAFICFALSSQAARLFFSWSIDPTQMVGLSTNDYCTNITIVVYTHTNLAVPMTNWFYSTNWNAASFLTQGPIGSMWNGIVPTDGNARWYTIQITNNNGIVSPFSKPAVLLTQPQIPVVSGISGLP